MRGLLLLLVLSACGQPCDHEVYRACVVNPDGLQDSFIARAIPHVRAAQAQRLSADQQDLPLHWLTIYVVEAGSLNTKYNGAYYTDNKDIYIEEASVVEPLAQCYQPAKLFAHELCHFIENIHWPDLHPQDHTREEIWYQRTTEESVEGIAEASLWTECQEETS